MKRICWNRPDTGTVERIYPSERHRLKGEADNDFLTRMAARLLPEGAAFTLMDDDALAFVDRTYRDAWTLDAGKGEVIHDMAKARAIHKVREAGKGRNVSDAALNAAKTIAELKAL